MELLLGVCSSDYTEAVKVVDTAGSLNEKNTRHAVLQEESKEQEQLQLSSRGQIPLPWLGSNDALPLATRMETRLPWRPTRGSLTSPSGCRKTSGFLSRETGISGNFVGRIKGAKCPFDLQFLTWDFS